MTERELFRGYSCPYETPVYERGDTERRSIQAGIIDAAGTSSVSTDTIGTASFVASPGRRGRSIPWKD